MLLPNDRNEFDLCIKNPRFTWLLVFGKNSQTEAVYNEALKDIQGDETRKVVYIPDVTVLTEVEKTKWVAKDGCYTTLATDGSVVVSAQAIAILCSISGKPSAPKIQDAFSDADLQ